MLTRIKRIFHRHHWTMIQDDLTLKSLSSIDKFRLEGRILRVLTGQTCECGAERQYRGPMGGWKIIKRGRYC